jgi:hypothetical protein
MTVKIPEVHRAKMGATVWKKDEEDIEDVL